MVHVLRFIVGLTVLVGAVTLLCWLIIAPGLPRSIMGALLLAVLIGGVASAAYAVGWFCHLAWLSRPGGYQPRDIDRPINPPRGGSGVPRPTGKG